MTALYIILGIVVVLLCVLFSPVRIKIRFEETFSGVISFWFLKYKIIPEKKDVKTKIKTVEKEEIKKSKKNKNKSIKEIIKGKGLSGFIDMIKELSRLATGTLKKLFKHFIIDDMNLHVGICGEDAADTAIKYGESCSLIYPAISIIINNVNTKKYHVNITPEFNREKIYLLFELESHVNLIHIVSTAFSSLIKFIKFVIKNRK